MLREVAELELADEIKVGRSSPRAILGLPLLFKASTDSFVTLFMPFGELFVGVIVADDWPSERVEDELDLMLSPPDGRLNFDWRLVGEGIVFCVEAAEGARGEGDGRDTGRGAITGGCRAGC